MVLGTQRIKWDSFKFNIEAMDETNVSTINLIFNIISNSDLNYVYFKYFEDKSGIYCHHSLRDMCVHIDGTWWKLKKCCQ